MEPIKWPKIVWICKEESIPTTKCPPCDTCSCFECGWAGKVSDCRETLDSEGWEYAQYTVHECPVCGDYVDNYDYSPRMARWAMRWYAYQQGDWE